MGEFRSFWWVLESDTQNSKNGIRMSITLKLSEIRKIDPYLDNFLTNPYTFLAYSGDLGSDKLEYTKKV